MRGRDKRAKNQFPEALDFMTKKEIILILILVTIAIVRFFFFIPKSLNFDNVVDKYVEFEGLINDNPDTRINNQQLIVFLEEHRTNILVIAPKEIDFSYGDKIKIKGILKSPENFITEAGKEFKYKRYLANKDIYYLIYYPEIEIISHENGNKIKFFLFNLRNSFSYNIEKVITFPENSLANGLLIGDRGGFDNEMREKFIETGTIHIVALSGYNISIISENVILFFSIFLSLNVSMFLGFIIIVLFIFMTGATGTAIRAGIMASILLLARITGRKYEASRALVGAFLIMIIYDLRFITDMSFQLSFLATGGILFILPKVINWFKFFPIKFNIRENIATTFSATIAVLPLILYSTGVFSIISLPANLLILPIIPVTMFFSFITGILGYISPLLSVSLSYLADIFLSYILFIVKFLASLPFASLSIKSFPLFLTILIYIFLFWWTFKKQK